MFVYTDPNGDVQRFEDVTGAQRAYADNDFAGSITVETADEALLTGAVRGVADLESDLITAINGGPAKFTVPKGSTRVLNPNCVSWYCDEDQADTVAEAADAKCRDGSVDWWFSHQGVTESDALKRGWAVFVDDDETPTQEEALPTTLPTQEAAHRTVAPLTVSSVSTERIEQHDRWLASVGLARPPAVVTTAGIIKGTTVIGLGYENLKASYERHEGQPTIEDSGRRVINAVRKEQREDLTVAPAELTLRDDGLLITPHGKLALEPRGLAQLLRTIRTAAPDQLLDDDGGFVDYVFDHATLRTKAEQLTAAFGGSLGDAHRLFPRFTQAFMAMDPDMRATVFNRQLRYADVDHQVVLRTRNLQTSGSEVDRAVFSVVSPGYAVLDADAVVDLMCNDLLTDQGFRGYVNYDPANTRLRIDATIHAPPDLLDFAAGDVFEMGLRVGSDDSGGGSIHGGALAFWNECINMIIIHQQNGKDLFRVVHKGDMEDVRERILLGLGDALDVTKSFAKSWGLLQETEVKGFEFRGQTFADVNECIETLCMLRIIDVGVKSSVLAEYVLQSYNTQGGGDVLSDIVDAFTRAAHEHLLDDIQRDRMERAAGKLVPVLVKAAA